MLRQILATSAFSVEKTSRRGHKLTFGFCQMRGLTSALIWIAAQKKLLKTESWAYQKAGCSRTCEYDRSDADAIKISCMLMSGDLSDLSERDRAETLGKLHGSSEQYQDLDSSRM